MATVSYPGPSPRFQGLSDVPAPRRDDSARFVPAAQESRSLTDATGDGVGKADRRSRGDPGFLVGENRACAFARDHGKFRPMSNCGRSEVPAGYLLAEITAGEYGVVSCWASPNGQDHVWTFDGPIRTEIGKCARRQDVTYEVAASRLGVTMFDWMKH